MVCVNADCRPHFVSVRLFSKPLTSLVMESNCCAICCSCGYSNHGFLLCSPSGKGIVCGDADGSLVRYMFEEEGGELTKVYVVADTVRTLIM